MGRGAGGSPARQAGHRRPGEQSSRAGAGEAAEIRSASFGLKRLAGHRFAGAGAARNRRRFRGRRGASSVLRFVAPSEGTGALGHCRAPAPFAGSLQQKSRSDLLYRGCKTRLISGDGGQKRS